MVMTNRAKLDLVRAVHTIIYLVMAFSVFFILYAGISKYRGVYLNISLTLVLIEGVVFLANGMKCPLTGLAKKYGAEKGYAFDTFLPEKITKYTFRFFTTILVIAIVLLIFNH